MRKIKIVFLGTNGWYDTQTGNTICTLIDAPEAYVVLDAGNGIYKLDQFIKDRQKPIYLFLSHFHLDHIIGLHILAKFRFKQGINICVPKGSAKLLKLFINRPFTAPIRNLKFKVRIIEIEGENKSIPFLVGYLRLKHVEPCYGVRLELSGKIIAFLPDTGICAHAFALAKKADLLITECAFKPGQRSIEWPHLNPEDAASIAKRAGAKRLVLVHFDAELYQTLDEREKAQQAARKVFKGTFAAEDNDEIEIDG